MKYILLILIALALGACAPAAIPDAPIQNVYVSAEQPLIINNHLNISAFPESQITSWGQDGKRTRLWFVTAMQLPTIAVYFDSQFLANSWIREDSQINSDASFASGRYSKFGEQVNYKLYVQDGSFRFETW